MSVIPIEVTSHLVAHIARISDATMDSLSFDPESSILVILQETPPCSKTSPVDILSSSSDSISAGELFLPSDRVVLIKIAFGGLRLML